MNIANKLLQKCLLFVFAFCLLTFPGARAQAQSEEESAAMLAKEGIELFKRHNYNEALKRFLMSYSLLKSARVAWNIARCYEELGELKQAISYFEQSAELDPSRYGRKAREKVKKLREQMASLEGVLEVAFEGGEGIDARITVDGFDVYKGKLPARVGLEPGTHKVEIDAGPDVEPLTKVVTLASGEVHQVVLKPKKHTEEEVQEAILLVTSEQPVVGTVRVVLDGYPVYNGPLPARIPLEPGRHKIEVEAGDEVEPVSRVITVKAGDVERIVLKPRVRGIAVHAEEEKSRAGPTSPTYSDPFLFYSSRMGSALGLEFSPILSRASRDWLDLPAQTFVGVWLQLGQENYAITLRGGRWARGMPTIHDFFKRAGLEIKFANARDTHFWSTTVFDIDYWSWSGLRRLAWYVDFPFGFLFGDIVSLELLLGLGYLIPDAGRSSGWGEWASIAIPMAGKLSVEIMQGNHLALEARWPIIIGPIGEQKLRETNVLADMSLGYRYVQEHFQVGAAIAFALNHLDRIGRERVLFIVTSQVQF